jgi:diaminohydroxyphosphoribosylaminopyrimidine deaminase/5-amino-6-(5-phosphoribosylamino)uracil reductase
MLDEALVDRWHMSRALELAERGRGFVEPNPLVGCVIVDAHGVAAEGWHARYGGPHAEVVALEAAAHRANGSTLYVTLEPCCHFGKTPPCVQAILRAGVRRVVAAMRDPFAEVSGRGLAELQAAGVIVEAGLMEAEARQLNAAYLKLLATGRPWVIAKWAMTLDGKINTSSGESQWITGPEARAMVHRLRGSMDAIVIGRGTAEADDPLLTARPPGARVATRVVLDSRASLSPSSQLAQTARQIPTLLAVAPEAPLEKRQALAVLGCEVFEPAGVNPAERLLALLDELGRRRLTNVLVEGGGRLLGSLLDAGQIDEAHVFIAPKIVGGARALSPVGGEGVLRLADALNLVDARYESCGADWHIFGRVQKCGTP